MGSLGDSVMENYPRLGQDRLNLNKPVKATRAMSSLCCILSCRSFSSFFWGSRQARVVAVKPSTATFQRARVVVLRDELDGQVLIAQVGVGAAAHVVLVQPDLGRQADEGTVLRFHQVVVQTSGRGDS